MAAAVILFQPEGGLPLSLARAASLAGQLSRFGALSFRALVASRVFKRADASDVAQGRRRLQHLAQISAGAAMAGLMLWLLMQPLAGTSGGLNHHAE